MWRALFIGWLAIALAEEAPKDTGLSKRQTARGNTVVYGAAPGQYTIQTPDRAGAQQQAQVSPDYQQQSDLYVIRKPTATALTYSSESPRRPQYIQLSPLQLQAAQQAAQHQHQLQQQQHQQQPLQQQQVAYESVIGQTEAGHGAFYRPAVRLQPEARVQQEHQQPAIRLQQESPASAQYAASAIVDSQQGSFERELAQLVAANRAQEQKYHASAAQPVKKQPAPQQYLKEVTRPVARPLPARLAPAPVQYQPHAAQQQQAAPLYRFVYQPDQLQQLPQASQQYKQPTHEAGQFAQYTRPQPQPQPQAQLQQYLQAQQQLRAEDARQQLSPAPASVHRLHAPASNEAPSPSRSSIYVSQSTPTKKPVYAPERDEEESAKQVPLVRIPTQRNRPLTQEEFQQILQSGGYTATLVPSDNPGSPHQEYLLHPTGTQRPAYANEKQEAVTYLLPQGQQQQQLQQRPVKRRPVYNLQQA